MTATTERFSMTSRIILALRICLNDKVWIDSSDIYNKADPKIININLLFELFLFAPVISYILVRIRDRRDVMIKYIDIVDKNIQICYILMLLIHFT